MNVALAGFGQEGRASYEYWASRGDTVAIADERTSVDGLPGNAHVILGSDAFSKLANYDVIIRSPSVNPKKLPYPGKVWSATNEFFTECPAPIIGVTGTKGKGTTSSLIASILKAAGKRVHLIGNIGTPALAELPNITSDDVVVFEMSSFQLWDIERSPSVAVVLGIEDDHLDVHDDVADYINAKAKITAFQRDSDLVVFNRANTIARKIASESRAVKVAYPGTDEEIAMCSDSLTIPGRHNIENASAAVAATSRYVNDKQIIRAGLHAFEGLPHRIKFIREVYGVRYYDDSYSSAPAASLAALKSFTEQKSIILGGYEKHADFTELAAFIAGNPTIKRAYLIGQTRQRLADALQSAGVDSGRYEVVDSTDFTEIVTGVARQSAAGDVVLLSPGCASFDMFKNFTDRGEQFIAIVEAL